MSDNKLAKVKIQVIAKYGHKCWLNGKISRDNPLTGHHIIPVRQKGPTKIDNIALLSDEKHRLFNELERIYPDLANEITLYFKKYHGNYNEEITERIDHIMSLVEKKQKQKCKKR